MGFLDLLPALLDALGPVLQKVLPDEGQRLQVRLELQKALIEQHADLGHAMAEVKADAGSESPLARNARPITVLWALLTVGIGVYMLARSVDKIVPQMVGSKG